MGLHDVIDLQRVLLPCVFVTGRLRVGCMLHAAGTSYGQLLHANSGLGQPRPSAGLESLHGLGEAMPRE